MVQWWIEWLRDRRSDRSKSLAAVRERAHAEAREALADYDAFVGPMRALTKGLDLGIAASSTGDDVAARLAWGDEYAHWLVQGGTGTGKTTWVGSLVRQALEARRPVGIIDGKGDLFPIALRLTAAIAARLAPAEREAMRDRLVVVNPFGEWLVPLNVCHPLKHCSAEVQAYEVSLALSRLFDSALGVHMESILHHLLILLIEARLSLVEAPQVLEDDVLRGLLAMRSTHPAVRDFFLQAWPTVPRASKDALTSRLRSLLLPASIRLMLGADGLIDLRDVLEAGRPMFVFLGKGAGVPEEQVLVLGNLFFQLLLQAAWARGSGGTRNYLIALDEFVHLLDAPTLARRFETALTTLRSYGLSLMLIHHQFAQLPPTLRAMMLGNCDLVALFRTERRNASFFVDFLPETVPGVRAGGQAETAPVENADRRRQLQFLQWLAQRELFWYDRRRARRAIHVRVPDVEPAHRIAGCTERELDERVRRDGWERGGAACTRQDLERQIEARQERLRELMRPTGATARPSGRPDSSKNRKPKLG